MAQDLQASHPGMKGSSRSSLFAMRQFYAFFNPQFEVVPQPVGQIPWGHVRTLLAKVKSVEQVLLYAHVPPIALSAPPARREPSPRSSRRPGVLEPILHRRPRRAAENRPRSSVSMC